MLIMTFGTPIGNAHGRGADRGAGRPANGDHAGDRATGMRTSHPGGGSFGRGAHRQPTVSLGRQRLDIASPGREDLLARDIGAHGGRTQAAGVDQFSARAVTGEQVANIRGFAPFGVQSCQDVNRALLRRASFYGTVHQIFSTRLNCAILLQGSSYWKSGSTRKSPVKIGGVYGVEFYFPLPASSL